MSNKPTITSPIKAIRAKCLECSCGSQAEVRECVIPDCALYPFRMGRNPFRKKRVLTEEQRAEMAERLARARTAGRDMDEEDLSDDEDE